MSAPESWDDVFAARDHRRGGLRLLFMDVDGTLTDGKVYIGEKGELFKAFDIKDGLGIREILPSLGITPVIITGRRSLILESRCAELGIAELHQGVSDKLSLMLEIACSYGVELSECAYIGDDVNDLACMNAVKGAGGVVGCPMDAAERVRNISDFSSSRPGGGGAVRDFIEWLRESQDVREAQG